MFFDYLNELCGFSIYGRIIIFDFQEIIEDSYLSMVSRKFGYNMIYYDDIEEFRYLYETEIKKNQDKYLVIIRTDIYLPYDIRCEFYCKNISYKELFPRLNTYILESSSIFDLNLLYIAYENLYRTISSEFETKQFLLEDMFAVENIKEYREIL